jgi:hypothetical protein
LKKILFLIILMFGILGLSGCQTSKDEFKKEKEALQEEARLSFLYFLETSNNLEDSDYYGLARDRYSGNTVISSIAATGFSLASIPVGVENGWISKEDAQKRASKTLDSLSNLDRVNGFFYHFVNIHTGAREWNSEVSIIDTGLLLAGALTVAQYFKGEVYDKAMAIYDEVNWPWYVNKQTNMFYMGYKPETGFGGAWDHVSEQLLLYVLAAGSRTYPTDDSLYKTVKQVVNRSYKGSYTSTLDPSIKTNEFIYSYDGSLFQHQFSHAFVDFRNLEDYEGTNWFDNAIEATKANYLYTLDYSDRYKTYSSNSWGISAGDGPGEYRAYGAMPAKSNAHNGTIMPYAALSSINYLEEEALRAAYHFSQIEQLNGTYGLKDSYNLGPVDEAYNPTMANRTPWYASDYIGIDKGITLLMIENYNSELIWTNFMSNKQVQNGLDVLGFTSN